MPEAEERIKKGDAASFSIPIGTPIIIEPSGLNEKIKTYFIGMEKKSYIIVSLTSLSGDSRLIYDYLFKGNRTKLFFTQEGVVNGFISKIIMYTTSPFRQIYFTYPTDAEFCNLRSAERTNCHLPAVLDMGATKPPGLVVNISNTGCALAVKRRNLDDIAFHTGDFFTLRFYLTLSMNEFRVEAEVKNVRTSEDMVQLGLLFHYLDDKTPKRIEEFIRHILSYQI